MLTNCSSFIVLSHSLTTIDKLIFITPHHQKLPDFFHVPPEGFYFLLPPKFPASPNRNNDGPPK